VVAEGTAAMHAVKASRSTSMGKAQAMSMEKSRRAVRRQRKKKINTAGAAKKGLLKKFA